MRSLGGARRLTVLHDVILRQVEDVCVLHDYHTKPERGSVIIPPPSSIQQLEAYTNKSSPCFGDREKSIAWASCEGAVDI